MIMNPNSLKNLIPNNQRTREELQEMGRKGGKASGAARRKAKESAVTITIDTTEGERFRIKGKTPEAAVEAAGELEDRLYLATLKARRELGEF